MNSFKSIERALEYEVSRQIEMAEKGTPIIQSTLRWDDVEGKTYLMRTKDVLELCKTTKTTYELQQEEKKAEQ